MPRDFPPSPWMTKSEAASYLGVSIYTIDEMLKDGRLTKYYMGGVQSVRISRKEADELMVPADQAQLRHAPKGPPPLPQRQRQAQA